MAILHFPTSFTPLFIQAHIMDTVKMQCVQINILECDIELFSKILNNHTKNCNIALKICPHWNHDITSSF